MAKILPYNGITRVDLPADQILDGAKGLLTGVLVLGYDQNGYEYFASSYADGTDALWLLERCKHRLMEISDGTTS